MAACSLPATGNPSGPSTEAGEVGCSTIESEATVLPARFRRINPPGINATNSADARNEMELTMNATSYPNRAAVSPPSAEPSVNCRKRVENMRTFAVNNSCPVTRFGNAPFLAASKKVPKEERSALRINTIQTAR